MADTLENILKHTKTDPELLEKIRDAIAKSVGTKAEHDFIKYMLEEDKPKMAMTSNPRDIEYFTKEMQGKYPQLLKRIVFDHHFETDSNQLVVVFYQDNEMNKEADAKDIMMMMDEVCLAILGTSMKTLKQLGVKFEFKSDVNGKYIGCNIDSMTRHILLNGQDDPYSGQDKIDVKTAYGYKIASAGAPSLPKSPLRGATKVSISPVPSGVYDPVNDNFVVRAADVQKPSK